MGTEETRLTNGCTNVHIEVCRLAATRMQIAGFDWDRGNRFKGREHGVSLAAIESMFRSSIPCCLTLCTRSPRSGSRRLGGAQPAAGSSSSSLWRARRGKRFIRPISARFMHKKEVEHYEKETAKLQKR